MKTSGSIPWLILALAALAGFASLNAHAGDRAKKKTGRPGLRENIEFARVGIESLTLDAFVPEGKGPFPTCILVHGGGFTRGDKQTFITPLFAPLSKAGSTWFTINYRLAPKHRWPACADDVATAIRWVRHHASAYKVDKTVPYEQSVRFQRQMKEMGNRCDLITVSGGGHGMGGWDKLGSDYGEKMIEWLRKTLK